jgi:pimeloyl-ACP methyl ester carboxylesterase
VPADPVDHRADVDDVPMRWIEVGSGPVVVLIHGIPTSPALWRRVVPELPDARLLAVEMVGYGRSWESGRARDIAVKAQAGYLSWLLEELDVSRAALVGHDLGGGVAQILAVQRPSLCAGLVLTNSIGYDSWPIPSVNAMRRAGALVERTPAAVFRPFFQFLIAQGHDDHERARESAAAHWPGYAHPQGAAAFVRQIRSLRTSDTLEVAGRLSELRVPAQVVWGAADRFQKLVYGERLARDLGAELDVVEGGKHFMPEDHPREIAAAIRGVLERAA